MSEALKLEFCECETCRLIDALAPQLEKFSDSKDRREHWFMLKCIRLATDLETWEALMYGEKVPKSRLDPGWVKAYDL